MAVDTEVPEQTGSVLDELMKDDVEETPSSEKEEEIVPDHEISITPDEDETESEEEESETEEKDEKEEELKLDEDKEDELELVDIPRKKEIEAKYPKIFKDFPQLERALFRNAAYSEVFATINDAKEAKQSLEDYNGFQSELMSGNIENVLN